MNKVLRWEFCMNDKHFSMIMIMIMLSMFFSCSDTKKSKLKEELTKKAGLINKVFITTRKNLQKRAMMIQEAYENQSQYNLDIKGMDVSEGGVYQFFDNMIYYPVKDKFKGKGMIACILQTKYPIYISPAIEYKPENFHKAINITTDGPEFKAIKKEIRLWENILLEVMNAGDKTGYKERASCFNPRNWLYVFDSYSNFTSFFYLDSNQKMLGKFNWVKNGTPFGNPEGKPKWFEKAINDYSNGWILPISMPVYTNGRFKIILTSSLFLFEFNKNICKKDKNMLLLIDLNTSVIGLSPSAKKTLGLKDFEDEYDILRSITPDPDIFRNENKLTSKKQTIGIKKLAAKILKGEKEFEVDIKSKSYTVIVEEIPEVKFYLIGLLESE